MSKGSPRVTVRIPRPILAKMEATIKRRNFYTSQEPWDLSAFILLCVVEKLAHMERSRCPRRNRRKESANQDPSPPTGFEPCQPSDSQPSPQSS